MILAGTTQAESISKKTVHQDNDGPYPGLSEDPWKKWIDNKGGSGLNSAGNQPKGGALQVQLQQPRRLEAPIEDRFNQQQSALQEMREKSDKDLESLRTDIAKLEKTICAQQQQVQHNLEMTNAEFRAIRTETQQHLQTMSVTFQDSLQKTLQKHDQQMYNQFNELKQLMLRKETKLSPPQKKQKGDINPEDDEDEKL